jgi:16S rRNA (adenine1518-N6/adenine1519-N6)-dimethyltransferase
MGGITQLLDFLRTLGVEPKKGLSQNFLIDGNILKKIVAEAKVQAGDSILEIGPGPGALTEALLAQGAIVYAVEKDRVYAEALKRFANVQVFAQDIREFDFSLLPNGIKVVANLPYHLTAPILTLLAPQHSRFTTLTLMVQEEVARRIAACPRTKEYGALTVFLNFYSAPHYAFKVSKHCFYPQPKVDSAVITLVLKKPPSVDREAFFSFVRMAFQHRRKMLKTTLGRDLGPLLEQLGENPQARPEDLSLDIFLDLFRRKNLI